MPSKKTKIKGNAMEMSNSIKRNRTATVGLDLAEEEQKEEKNDDNDDTPEKERGSKLQRFHRACLTGDAEIAQSLIEKGIDIAITDEFGRTPLHNAILGKQAHIVKLLLTRGASVEVQDERGDTPLHTAVRVGDEKILEFLMQNPYCDVNATGRAFVTPLHLAAGMDRVNACKMLIEHNARFDNRDEEKMTPMAHAVERGASAAVEYFFHLAKITQLPIDSFLYNVDVEGSSLLHMAVEGGVVKIVDLCLQNGARVRCPKVSDKSTAFHLACAQGALEIVKLLVSHDSSICRITLLDNEWQTPLHRAAANNHVMVVEFLLDQGAEVDPPDKMRCTPLFKAAGKGGADTVKLLLERGADVTVKTIQQKSVLHAAVPYVNAMELLLKVPSSAYLITDKDNKSFTPVHYAAAKGQTKNISLLMDTNKAAAAVTSNDLDTPLHLASKYGWLPVVENLLVGRNIRMINLQNNKGKTPLHLACGNGHDQVTEYLLSKEATMEKDQHENTALHLAATRGSKRCVLAILDKHPDCLNTLDESKNTAMNLAAIEGHDELVTYFLSMNEQQILMNAYNQNALDIAINEERKDVAMAIAEHPRWREVMTSSATGLLSMIEILVIKMPDVAERILDNCVVEEGDQMKAEYKVKKDFTVIQGKYVTDPNVDQLFILKTMVRYRRDNCLTHKLVYTLMHLKWKKFGFAFLMFNLFVYLLFLIPLTLLTMYARGLEREYCAGNETVTRESYPSISKTRSDVIIQVLSYLTLATTFILVVREIKQMIKLRWTYFETFSNYLELCGYITAIIYAVPSYDCRTKLQVQVGGFSMFFGWMNLILYLRQLSFYGSYIIMLATMFLTLFRVLLLFLLFILAFGTTFYVLMDNDELAESLPHWLLTIFVMTLGELNYADNFMPWDFPFSTVVNVLFVIFVLAMPIILMNMLVGLAVGDIDNIQKNATMDRYVMQVSELIDIEEQLPHWVRKRVQFNKHTDFPNKTAPLKSRLYDAICGFGHPGGDEEDEEETEATPEVLAIQTKLEEQEAKIQEISTLLRKQTEILENMSKNTTSQEKRVTENKEASTFAPKFFGLKPF